MWQLARSKCMDIVKERVDINNVTQMKSGELGSTIQLSGAQPLRFHHSVLTFT